MTRLAAQRRTAVLALTAALAVTLAGCSSGAGSSTGAVSVPGASAAQNKTMQKLYSSAVKANKTQIVLYGPAVSASQPLYDEFTKSFPSIKFVSQDQPDSTTLSKLKVEAKSGKRQADLYMGGGPTVAAASADPTLCTAINIGTVPKSDVNEVNDGRLLEYSVRYFGFVYNTKMVKKSEVPTTWKGLLASRWKNKIELPDPIVLGGAQILFADMLLPSSKDQFGEDYLQKLAAQNPTYSSNEPDISSDVASGRFPIGVAVYYGYYAVQKAKGASINFVFPLTDGGNFLSPTDVCQVTDAPHTAAAELFLDWLYTKQGQKDLAYTDHSFGTLAGSPGPKGSPKLPDVKGLPTLGNDLSKYGPYFATVVSTFKK